MTCLDLVSAALRSLYVRLHSFQNKCENESFDMLEARKQIRSLRTSWQRSKEHAVGHWSYLATEEKNRDRAEKK